MTTNPLIAALAPITSRVRQDVTAVRRPDGGSIWTRDALTPERMAAHLGTGPARGVCPIKAGESTTMLGLLDFDSHGGEVSWSQMAVVAQQVMDTLDLVYGAPSFAFRSSGGRGVHLYVLWETPQDAYSVRQWLAGVLGLCGLKPGTKGVVAHEVEIFPKQNEVPAAGFGNQFILPLAGKSELLLPCELSGMLVGAPAEVHGLRNGAVLDVAWACADPVPVLERPVRTVVALAENSGENPTWRQALDAIPNGAGGAGNDLGYDDWWRIVTAIHYETGGSDEGFALAMAWSERSSKFDAEFLENRIWPYIHSDGAGGSVTGGTIMSHASRHHGWTPAIDDSAFEVIPDDTMPDRRALVRERAGDRSAQAVAMAAEAPPRQGIPKARHLCTDQANANRIVTAYGANVLVAAGKWHVWDGKRWKTDEADVYRYACQLSTIIKDEARRVRERAQAAGPDPAELKRAEAIADALEKWSTKSEMKGAIEAAVGLARKMLTVEPDLLDRDPWLLNCLNGVVDLRTGQLHPHRSADFITKLVELEYDPAARSELWERTLLQITREDGAGVDQAPVASFLQRWFGYCATGDVREQVFVVHWGDGSNGKSTLLDTVARVLGSYAGTAAPGLVAGGRGDSHPTEVADLHGLRMVTASETRDGVQLNEDFVKRATGDAKMKARYMREDFFEFTPTHKIQLLTNAKPQVRGQDHGIWRRVRLVAYTARFGSAEDVAKGFATAPKNLDLLSELGTTAALQGVLAWLVHGPVEGARDGLQAPSAVLEASEDYRRAQDRVQQFVEECCEVGAGFEDVLTMGMGGGLYPAYTGWCKDTGIHSLARGRLITELQRVVPGLRFEEAKKKNGEGIRRKVTSIRGLRLLSD